MRRGRTALAFAHRDDGRLVPGYLAESYLPKATLRRVRDLATRLERGASRDLRADARLLALIASVDDDTAFYLFDAAAPEDVIEAGRLVDLTFQRITSVLWLFAEPGERVAGGDSPTGSGFAQEGSR